MNWQKANTVPTSYAFWSWKQADGTSVGVCGGDGWSNRIGAIVPVISTLRHSKAWRLRRGINFASLVLA